MIGNFRHCFLLGLWIFFSTHSHPVKRRRSAPHSSTVGLNWVCPWVVPCYDTPRLVSESGLRSHMASVTLLCLSLVLPVQTMVCHVCPDTDAQPVCSTRMGESR